MLDRSTGTGSSSGRASASGPRPDGAGRITPVYGDPSAVVTTHGAACADCTRLAAGITYNPTVTAAGTDA